VTGVKVVAKKAAKDEIAIPVVVEIVEAVAIMVGVTGAIEGVIEMAEEAEGKHWNWNHDVKQPLPSIRPLSYNFYFKCLCRDTSAIAAVTTAETEKGNNITN